MTKWQTRFISLASLAVAMGAVAYTNMYPDGSPSAYTPSDTSKNLTTLSDAIDVGESISNTPPVVKNPTTPTKSNTTSSSSSSSTSSNTTSSASSNTSTSTASSSSSTTSTSKYKDGTYTAVGAYFVPEGSERISVTVTISNDIITDATVTGQANRGDSRKYINRFISGFTPYVVGQSVDSVYLTRISGASLTPNGFNAALDTIKSQAAA